MPPLSRPRLPATVVALGVTSLFTDIGSEMIFPLLPAFVASLGAGPGFLGLVEGVADAIASLLKLLSGYVSDRVDRRKPLVVFGYGIATLARPLVAFAMAPWHVLVVRAVDRVGKGIRGAPRDALIAGAIAPGQAGRAFGFHRAMDHSGAVLGPLIATVLLAAGVPLRTVFLLAVVPGVLAVVAVSTARDTRARAATVAEPAPALGQPALRQPALSPPLRAYLGIVALFSLGCSSDAFLLLRAHQLGVSLALLPVLWSALHISKVLSSQLGGAWADRFSRPRMVVAGWLVYGLTYLGFGVARSSWQVWALFSVYGLYYGLSEPAEKALIKDLADERARGRAYGAYNFITGITAVPAGLLTGWLWQTIGPLAALAAGTLIAFFASAALLVWERRHAAALGAGRTPPAGAG